MIYGPGIVQLLRQRQELLKRGHCVTLMAPRAEFMGLGVAATLGSGVSLHVWPQVCQELFRSWQLTWALLGTRPLLPAPSGPLPC